MFHDDPPFAVTEAPMRPAPVEEGTRWRGVDLVAAALLVALEAAGVIAALASGIGGARGDVDGPVSLLGALVMLAFEVWIGLVVLGLARARGISMYDLGFRRPRDWNFTVYALAGAYGVVLGYTMGITLAESVTGADLSSLNQGNSVPRPDNGSLSVWVVLGVALIVAAPLAEELLFRGLIFRALAPMRGVVFAIVASGVAFALMHFNASVVVPFAVIGMVFAWAYRQSGSLWTTIAAHAMFNGIGFFGLVAGVQR